MVHLARPRIHADQPPQPDEHAHVADLVAEGLARGGDGGQTLGARGCGDIGNDSLAREEGVLGLGCDGVGEDGELRLETGGEAGGDEFEGVLDGQEEGVDAGGGGEEAANWSVFRPYRVFSKRAAFCLWRCQCTVEALICVGFFV